MQRLRPFDPESKDVVERRIQFFETSFMPGRVVHGDLSGVEVRLDGRLVAVHNRI